MDEGVEIRFTRHAKAKFDLLRHYGFDLEERSVSETIRNPTHLEQRGEQCFAVRVIDERCALRVVYEKRKGYLLVITFYPVRRERYGL